MPTGGEIIDENSKIGWCVELILAHGKKLLHCLLHKYLWVLSKWKCRVTTQVYDKLRLYNGEINYYLMNIWCSWMFSTIPKHLNMTIFETCFFSLLHVWQNCSRTINFLLKGMISSKTAEKATSLFINISGNRAIGIFVPAFQIFVVRDRSSLFQ